MPRRRTKTTHPAPTPATPTRPERFDSIVYLANLDRHEEIFTHEQLDLDGDRVALHIGYVTPDAPRTTVASTDPGAVRHQHDILATRRAVQRRYGPVTPVPKPTGGKRGKPAKPASDRCPACAGLGQVEGKDGVWQECRECEGSGRVRQ